MPCGLATTNYFHIDAQHFLSYQTYSTPEPTLDSSAVASGNSANMLRGPIAEHHDLPRGISQKTHHLSKYFEPLQLQHT